MWLGIYIWEFLNESVEAHFLYPTVLGEDLIWKLFKLVHLSFSWCHFLIQGFAIITLHNWSKWCIRNAILLCYSFSVELKDCFVTMDIFLLFLSILYFLLKLILILFTWSLSKDSRLNNNSLTGPIPMSLTNIPSLQVLWVPFCL